MEAIMAHLTLQPGAAITVPLGRRARGALMEMLSSIASVVAAALLAGCANVFPVPTTVVTAGMPNPEQALQDSMQHVDAEMAELGTMGSSYAQAALASPVVPEDLQRIVSFTWSGSLDKGVAKLAQSIGYTFYTTAPPGTPPLDVTVQIQSAPAVQVFKAFGDQAGTRATVEVDPLHHQVQVFHHV
jgi:defect-in-organelle-trafficking protein DotD